MHQQLVPDHIHAWQGLLWRRYACQMPSYEKTSRYQANLELYK